MRAAKPKAVKSANNLDQGYEYGRISNSEIDPATHNLLSLRESQKISRRSNQSNGSTRNGTSQFQRSPTSNAARVNLKTLSTIEQLSYKYRDEDIQASVHRWIIRIHRPLRIRWDLFVMTLAIWNWFSIPFIVAFLPTYEDDMVFSLNLVIDSIFICDIVVNFRTTYFSRLTGDEISDPQQIARNYIVNGQFFVDLLASVPIDLLVGFAIQNENDTSQLTLSILGLLKLTRIIRLSRIINYMRAKDDVKVISRLWQLFLFIVMYVHVMACMWFILVRTHQEWIPPTDFLTSVTDIFAEDTSVWWQYWIWFYTSVFLLWGGEVAPRRPLEAGFASVVILIGAVITALLFGQMTVLMSNINRKMTKFRKQQDEANTTMKNMKLSKKLQIKINNYMIYTYGSLNSKSEQQKFLNMLSPSYKSEVILNLYSNIIQLNQLFNDHEDMQKFIMRCLENDYYRPEQTVVSQGEPGDKMFFIAKGECAVLVTNQKDEFNQECILKAGCHFGEISLIYNVPRTSTVRSLDYSLIAEMQKKHFDAMITNFPQTKTQLKDQMSNYNDILKEFLRQELYSVPYLEDETEDVIEELIYSCEPQQYQQGSYLFKPGQTLDSIIFIFKGQVELSASINSKNLHTYKRKAKWNNMEPYDANLPCEQYPPLLRLTKQFKVYSSLLKDKPDIIPTFGYQGLVGCSERTSGEIATGYFQEIVLKTLGPDSIIGQFHALMGETVMTQAKALTNCKIYKLPIKRIEMLQFQHDQLNTSVETVKQMLQKKEGWFEVTPMPTIDYNEPYMCSRDMYLLKFKSSVLKIISIKRENSFSGIQQLREMIKAAQENQNTLTEIKNTLSVFGWGKPKSFMSQLNVRNLTQIPGFTVKPKTPRLISQTSFTQLNGSITPSKKLGANMYSKLNTLGAEPNKEDNKPSLAQMLKHQNPNVQDKIQAKKDELSQRDLGEIYQRTDEMKKIIERHNKALVSLETNITSVYEQFSHIKNVVAQVFAMPALATKEKSIHQESPSKTVTFEDDSQP